MITNKDEITHSYTITLAPSGEYLIWEDGGIQPYARPTITLFVGIRYEFKIDTPGQPFYLTTDSQGGGGSLKPAKHLKGAISVPGNSGIKKGSLFWKPDLDHLKMKLFYQSDAKKGIGNSITVMLRD